MTQYYCKDTKLGIWPVGFLAVINADNEEEAVVMLNQALVERKLEPNCHISTIKKMPTKPGAVILLDGNY